jgi:RNA polymerase sigma factor (sigma-70 family)
VTTLANVEELEPLVAAAASGDADAFGRIISVTSGLVSSVALAIVRDVDLSQEVAQDVFLSAWRDLKKLRNPASLLPWLRQMTRNRAHHVLRTRVRSRRWIVQLTGNDEQAESVADSRGNAAEHLLAAEQRAVLRARASLRGAMLERLGETLAVTRPRTAFTLAIMTALPLTMPPAASAATAGMAKMASAAATKSGGLWPWVFSLLMSVGGVVLGALGGLIGRGVRYSRCRQRSAGRARTAGASPLSGCERRRGPGCRCGLSARDERDQNRMVSDRELRRVQRGDVDASPALASTHPGATSGG